MHRRTSLHVNTGAVLFVVLLSVAATAGAQLIEPTPGPVNATDGPAAATAAPHILPGAVVIPESSQPHPGDRGKRAHTNVRYISPSNSSNPLVSPYSGYAYETPASLACLYYMVVNGPAGCNPLTTPAPVASGGSKVIAIVDAYDNPDAAADLDYFSSQFGLPFSVGQFHVVYTGGVPPLLDSSGGWELESALDVEYAHAMAPSAKIYLVEAYDNELSNLMLAVQEAINIVQCANFTTAPMACGGAPSGKGEVSMSWGAEEWSGETTYDATFATANSAGVVFLAATDDAPGTIYPSSSPYVISVGGTTVSRSLVNGNFQAELGWDDAGGGRSIFEAEPSFQSPIPLVHAVANGNRATPDVAAVANPYTGVFVYDTFPIDNGYGDWWSVGGTSVATPLWAGVLNWADTQLGVWPANTQAELSMLYNDSTVSGTYSAAFRDITYGYCNYYMSSRDTANYDLCTGLGSPKTKNGK